MTGYVPVTCSCKTCKRLFVEWFADYDCLGRTLRFKPNLDCDECFAQRVLPMYREEVRRKFAQRSSDMLARYPHADLRLLDPVHAEMFKRKVAGLTAGVLDDTFSHTNKSIRRND